MFKEFFEKYSRNQTARKDKEIMSKLVAEGNERLKELKDIDQEILYIQKSTRTTFSFFSPVHNFCRTKYEWYYNWSAKPYATKIHVGVLTLFILVGLAIGSFSIIGNPATTHAATTDCTWNNGGGNNIWNNAANWSCGEVPDNTKDVIFNGAVSNADITIDVAATAGSFTVNDATSGGGGVAGQATAENTGNHLNFSTNSANVAVSGAGVFSGYGWSEDLGWIAFGTADNAADGPVSENTSTGAVTGKAKILNDGSLIDFNASPYNSNVVVNTGTGAFSGYAWSTSLGWINFTGVSLSSPAYTGTITVNTPNSLSTTTAGTGTGDFTMNDGSITGTGNVTVVGNVAGSAGVINMTGGTFTQNVAAAKNFSTTSGSTAWTFNNLTFSSSTGTPTITTSTTGTGDITVNAVLNIAASTTFDAGNRTYHLMGSSTPFTKNGTFTANTSTISYENTTGATITGSCAAAGTYYNLQTNPASGTPTYTLQTGSTSFLAGTKVKTDHGEKNIEDFKIGDKVLSYDFNSNQPVMSEVADFITGTKDGYYIINNKVKATGNHIFILPDNSQKAVEDMKIGDILKTYAGQEIIYDIQKINQTVPVYDIEVKDYHLFYAENYLVHNPCALAVTATNNFTLAGAGSATVDANTNDPDIDVNGNFSIGANQAFLASDLYTFTIFGNFTNSGTFTHNSGIVTFDGTATGKTINPGSSSFYNLTFNGSGGAWSPLTNTVTVTNDLTMTAGTFDTSNGTANVTVNGNVACGASCGTINMTATNTFTQNVAANKNFGTTSGSTNWTFNNLNFENSSAGDLTVTTPGTATGQIIVGGTLTVGNAADSNTTTLDNETNDRIIDANGAVAITSKGVLSASSTASFTVAGNWTNNGGTFTSGNGTVTFDGTGAQTINGSSASQTFYNFIVAKTAGQLLDVSGSTTTLAVTNFTETTGDFTAPATFNISGNLTLTSGTFTPGDNTNIGGNWTNNGGTFTSTGTVTFNGTAGQAINGTAATQTFGQIIVAKTAGTLLSVSGSTTTLSTPYFTETTGDFTAPATFNIYHTLSLATGTFTAGANTYIGSYWAKATAATFVPGTNTVTFYAFEENGGTILGTATTQTFYNLVIAKTPGTTVGFGGSTTTLEVTNFTETTGNFNGPATFNIAGNVTLTAGTFTAGTNTNVGGNWTNNGGTFTHSNGTVTFNGIAAQTLTGNTTFNNLTMDTNANGANQINFTAGSTQTINGTWTLDGAVGKVLTLRSTTPGTAWKFVIPANFTAGDYIDVKDSYSANANKITPGANVTNSGNNDGWIFNSAPNAPTVLGPDGYVDGAWQTDNTPTLTFNLTDPDGADQVKYEIIISTNADFSSPTIDYTSALDAQGARSYTPDPALANGQYYWEVKTIDASNVSSSYAIAGDSGTADIKVDTAVPTTDIYLNPTDPNGANDYYKTTAPTVTFTADDGTGSGASTIYYRWGATGDFSAYSVGISAPEGTNTIYYYGTDLAGNSGVASPFSREIKTDTVTPSVTATANPVGPNGSNNYYTGTAPTITLSSTDITSGLLNIKYKWDADSYATYSTPLTAAEGTHTLYYYAVDNAGNTSVSSPGSTTYNVDTGIPTVSVVADPLAPNGTNGYYITTAPTITLSALDTGGSGVAFIQYKWDSGSYATYSTPLTASEGTHTLYYYSIDTAGNNSAEANEIFKTDLTNPTIDIYANPADPDGTNGYYKTAPAITFTGLDTNSGLENIYYHWDSNADSTYTTGFNAPEGHHIIHYYAKDNAGNQTADITRDYYVDTNTPTVSAASDPVSANGSNGYFTGAAPTISLTGDDNSNSGIASIKYRWDAGEYSDYSIQITAPEGTHTLYYYAIDNAGNSGASSPFSRTIKTDTANPSATTPSASSPTNDTTPTWSWSASTDVESGIAGYYVKIGTVSGGNNTLGETYLAGSGTLTYTSSSPLSDNSYYLSVKAKDTAGNIGDYTSSTALLVDAAVPAITALTINNGDLTTGSLNITLQITVSDASSGLSARQFSQDGVTYSDWESCDNTTCNDEKAYTLNTGDGTKTVYLKLKDVVGNESDASSDTILLDTTGPGAFSLLSPINDSWSNATSMRLTWEGASDLISGLTKYQLYLDDAIVNDNISNSITLYDLSNLSPGTHSWQVKAIDSLNNETLSEKRTFSIDQTAPTAPTALTITNLSNTDLKLVKDMPVKFAWTASQDSGAGVSSYLIYIGTTSGASDIINGEEVGTPNYDANLQKDGTYFVTIRAKDGAGNIGALSDEYSFKVDHTAPNTIAKTVSFDISNRIADTYSAYIAWSPSADPSGEGIKEYVVYSDNERIATIPFSANSKESPRRLVQTNLKPGSYSFKVAPVDLADNLGAFSAESKLEILAEAGPALLISEIGATPSTLVDPDSGKTSILVSWKTNALATSVVELEGKLYGEEDLTKLNTGHSILITDLKASTTYRFTAKSRDIFGGQAVSESTTVRTGAIVEKQSTLEIILNSLRDIFSIFKNVSAATLEKIGLIKPTQITKEGLIAFNVSDPDVGNAVVISLAKAGQQIERSTDGKNFSSLAAPSESYYIDDQVTLENTYYYRLSGSNGIARINIGNKEDSAPVIFEPKVIEEATQVADDKVRVAIGWQTDIPATSQLSYGIGETNLESTKDDNLNTNHFVVLEGLKSGTEYKFKAKSMGENNLTSESSEFAFVTPKTVESQSIINMIIRQLQDAFAKLIAWMRV